jgi:hypothetical protein
MTALVPLQFIVNHASERKIECASNAFFIFFIMDFNLWVDKDRAIVLASLYSASGLYNHFSLFVGRLVFLKVANPGCKDIVIYVFLHIH